MEVLSEQSVTIFRDKIKKVFGQGGTDDYNESVEKLIRQIETFVLNVEAGL